MNNKIEHQLQVLRKRWKNEPENRRTIELQAKVLKLSLQEYKKPAAAVTEDPFVLKVAEALL